MAMMPGNVSKGREIRAFESFINASKANLNAALAEYENPANDIDAIILWAVNPARGILTGPDQSHIRTHWFKETPGMAKDPYWETFTPMGEVFKDGLAFALNMCKKKLKADGTFGSDRTDYLPVDVHWICAGSHYEIVVTLGFDGADKDHHVNMLILTPTVPFSRREHQTGPLTDENIWVVKQQDLGANEQEVARDATRHVVTSRLKNKP